MEHTVRTYEKLSQYTKGFAKGAYNLMFLIGAPGQSKSTILRESMVREHLWVEGNVSAFKLYQRLYDYRDKPLILDDVDSAFRDRELVRLLKCLCQTEDSKTVSWNTDNRRLDLLEIPNEFRTKSKVCIIANEWQTLNRHVGSLTDRGILIKFEPTPREVHAKAKTFFKDKEILDFFEQYLPCLDEISLRLYTRAAEIKASGVDWREPAMESIGLREVVIYQELIHDRSFVTQTEREMVFMKRTGLSRPMFYDAKKKYENMAAVLPKLPSKKKGVPSPQREREVAVAN